MNLLHVADVLCAARTCRARCASWTSAPMPCRPMTVQFDVVCALSESNGHLIEIRRRDPESDAPNSRTFQWLWIDADRVINLQFRFMRSDSRQERSFEEGEAWFHVLKGELSWNRGQTVPLTTVRSLAPPPQVVQRIAVHAT